MPPEHIPPTPPTPPTPPAPGPGPADPNAELKALQASNAALIARLEKLEGKPADDPGLLDKVKKDNLEKDKKNNDSKALEAALRFNLNSAEFLKTNAALLPKDVADIFTAAEKENYGGAIEKDAAIKAGIIQSFFSVQANMDLLTPGLKSTLEDYLKLTKTGKQEKAQQIYEGIFEPGFEMLKRITKAQQLNTGGGRNTTDSETAYKEKMVSLSRKHYLGEKQNA